MPPAIVMNVRISGGSEFNVSLALAPTPASSSEPGAQPATKVLPAGSSVLAPGHSLSVAASVPAWK